jgi:spore coat protein A, manganese oxidase
MINRRSFIKYTVALGAGMFLTANIDPARVFASSPGMSRAGRRSVRKADHRLQLLQGEVLDPTSVPKYVTPLVIPPPMPQAKKPKNKGPRNYDYYEIAVQQFQQNILPDGMGMPTTVWSYAAAANPATRNYPAFTIEAKWNKPVRVKWINGLVDNDGNPLPHLLPVDPTLHWANPPGGDTARDTRPTFTETPGPYTGPVPMVTHVHGAAGVGDESDGYAEAWFLPNSSNIPAGYARVGTWYDFFKQKFLAEKGEEWAPGTATFQYPNSQRASTVWYHDHTLGMTRLNVYAGPAGFFIIRGGPEGDASLLDARSGGQALLPGPAPQAQDRPGTKYYEIPIAVQDRAFKTDGSLFYPDTRAFFDGITGPYIPDTDISPIWNPEFFGNTIVVNGKTWPFLNVEQRRYRFRFLNGCDARFLILDFSNIPGVEVWQIGNEGGFLATPVNMTAVNGSKLLMSPAERADVIIDFTNVPLGSHILANIGPDEPYGGGVPGVDFSVADPATTGQVMRFNVGPIVGVDPSTPPQFLVLPAIKPLPSATVTRPVALLEEMSMYFADAPAAAMLGTVAVDPDTGIGTWSMNMWMDPITENPAVGATEIWEFYNATVDAHPMHIHEVLFQVIDRQDILVNEVDKTVQVDSESSPTLPAPWENGWKDTVIALPGQVTRVKAQFNNPGQFVWHCHIVEHEDNEMMRPFRIGPPQPGQPGGV